MPTDQLDTSGGPSSETLARFVRRAAHEWNNQAAALVSFAAVLQLDVDATTDAGRLTAELRAAAARLHEHFADLDACTRLDAATRKVQPLAPLLARFAPRAFDGTALTSELSSDANVFVTADDVELSCRLLARLIAAAGRPPVSLSTIAGPGTLELHVSAASESLARALAKSATARFNDTPEGVVAAKLGMLGLVARALDGTLSIAAGDPNRIVLALPVRSA